MNPQVFYKMVLKALYIIMMQQQGYSVMKEYFAWTSEYRDMMKGE